MQCWRPGCSSAWHLWHRTALVPTLSPHSTSARAIAPSPSCRRISLSAVSSGDPSSQPEEQAPTKKPRRSPKAPMAGTKKRTIDAYFAKSPKKLAPTTQESQPQDTAAAPKLAAVQFEAAVHAPLQPSASPATAAAAASGPAPAVTSSSAAAPAPVPEPAPASTRGPAAPASTSEPPTAAQQARPRPVAWPISSAPPTTATSGQPPSGFLVDLLQEPSWRAALDGELRKPSFASLQKFVEGELAPGKPPVFPPRESIFRAMNSCPFDSAKVVILGQDPYHGPGQAMGMSFSVPPGIRLPPSLQNIFKELEADLDLPRPNHGNLEKWAGQGVLLLNAVMTVRASEPASHAKKGWEQFTDGAIKALATKRSGLVFMLWGKFAESKASLIPSGKHLVLVAAHPSGLSANRGFFGCRHFSKANRYLEEQGQQPIDWKIERV